VFRDKPGGQLVSPFRARPENGDRTHSLEFLAAIRHCIEIITDSGLTDIVRDRFDAGIRPGHRVERT